MKTTKKCECGNAVPQEVREAIEEVVEYCWLDELKDYRDREGARDHHIFVHLAAVQAWLDGSGRSADQYVVDHVEELKAWRRRLADAFSDASTDKTPTTV